jgi:hypothetical protein
MAQHVFAVKCALDAAANLPSTGTLVGVSATLKLNAFPACRVLQIAATIIH